MKRKHIDHHETLVSSKKRQSSSPAAPYSTLDAFVIVSRSAKKYNVEFTNNLGEFKKAAVEAVTVNGLLFSVFEASGIKKMLQPIINNINVCLNRRAVRSMVINQAADYRKSLAVALKNKLVSIKFETASRKGRGYQRWGPRGHILKSLALVLKPKVVKNCPVLGSFLNC